ncbi:MAG: prolipoprotein diacylglyceryl transferase [Oscillospiraceae bacterium]|nr:prolipoprotein diacylglyceryl transferase [Oscillospiraceae bacterium]
MNQIAFVFSNSTVYWSSIVVAAAALCAMLAAVMIRLWRNEPLLPVLVYLPVATVLSVFFARLIHWYCRTDQYTSLSAALQDFTGGGYALLGVFAGCFLAAVLVRVLRLTDDLPSLLDSLAPAAALGIGMGRLCCLFNADSRGKMFVEDPARQKLPIGSPVVNATSGEIQWRFATFFIQSLIALAIFAILLIVTVIMLKLIRRQNKRAQGMTFLIFMVLYCSSQIVMDSTRYDALFLRSNGFVSLEQIFSIVVLVGCAVIFSIRSVKQCGLRLWHPVLWALILGCFGGTGYMEYYVQRHGSLYMMCYSIMSACLLIAAVLSFVLCFTAICGNAKGRKGLFEAAQK